MRFDRRSFLAQAAVAAGSWSSMQAFSAIRSAWAGGPEIENFAVALERARDQTVYFNAWAGDQHINNYITWTSAEVGKRFGINLRHVKLGDTGEGVARVVAEKTAGRFRDGSVDLIWINGENFAALKDQNLLFGPFTGLLPNMKLVDPAEKPTTAVDFTLPVEGMEAPWGMAQLVFFHDSAKVKLPPRSIEELRAWSEKNPGRFTYPTPPDFIGASFLKQALYAVIPEADVRSLLLLPAQDAVADKLTAPLWNFLDSLHPYLWRAGKAFPSSASEQRQLLADGEVDIYMAFNPGDASAAIAQKLLPDTMRSYVMKGGSLANTHFLAIPFNASAKEGAMVVANFLLSPEAQAHKQDPNIWGDPTVLSLKRLEGVDRARFDDLQLGIATLPPDQLGPQLAEPHPSWVAALEGRWRKRFAS